MLSQSVTLVSGYSFVLIFGQLERLAGPPFCFANACLG